MEKRSGFIPGVWAGPFPLSSGLNPNSGTTWDNLITGIASGGATTTFVIDAPSPGTYYRIRKE